MIDPSTAVDLCRATLLAAVVIAAPMLLVGMAAGLVVGLMQALTQIQDQTVAFVPKILAMAAVLVACLPWLVSRMVDFTRVVFDLGGMPLMESLSQWFVDHLVLGVLVLTRLSTLLMAMPAVGVGVPRRVREFLAVLLTVLLVPSVADGLAPSALPAIDNLIDLAIAIAREGLIGMLIGATIQVIITGLQLGGEAMTSTGGMQLGDAVDPTTSSSMPSIARLVGLLVTAVMLGVGGHRILLMQLLHSFEALPAGDVHFHESMMTLVIDQLSAGMQAGVRVAAPVLAALLLSNLVTGLISRTLPQINVLAIGLSINALAMLMVLAITIGSVGLIFQQELEAAVDRLQGLW